MDEKKLASLLEVKAYFGYANLREFKTDWERLSDESRQQIREGIGNGTYTY